MLRGAAWRIRARILHSTQASTSDFDFGPSEEISTLAAENAADPKRMDRRREFNPFAPVVLKKICLGTTLGDVPPEMATMHG